MAKNTTDRQKCRSGCSEFGRHSAHPLCNGGYKVDRGGLEKKKITHRIIYVFKCLHQVASLMRLLSPLLFRDLTMHVTN